MYVSLKLLISFSLYCLVEIESQLVCLDDGARACHHMTLVDPSHGDVTLDATTPVVEIEEPLLSAIDIVDGLLQQTAFKVDLEGVNILLFSEPSGDTVTVCNKLIIIVAIQFGSIVLFSNFSAEYSYYRCIVISSLSLHGSDGYRNIP